LEAEVVRYRFLMEEHDNLALHCQRIDREDLANNNAIIRTGRFLANTRGVTPQRAYFPATVLDALLFPKR